MSHRVDLVGVGVGGGRNRDRGQQQMRQTDGALSECTLIFINKKEFHVSNI